MRGHARGACLDVAGNIVTGVSVEVRDEGTINPIAATIYANDSGATTKTNPFNVNTLGEYDFYLEAPARVDLFISGGGYTARTITVDVSEISGGGSSDIKASVRAATTGNITLSGAQTIDGVAVIAGDRVLVKDQTSGATNGVYTAAAGAWTRADDANTSAEVTSGMLVPVTEGTVNGDSLWQLSTNDPIVLGTTVLVFGRDSSLFGTPAITLGTAAAAGVALTGIRTDATIVAFDATVPTTIAFGDAAAAGSIAFAAHRDHRHGMPAQIAGGVDVLAGLVTQGLRAASANPPLNLGTGALTAGTTSLGALTASSVTASSLTATRVTFAGVAGLLSDAASLTFNSGTGALSATSFVGAFNGSTVTASSLTSGRVPFASTAGLLTDASTFTFASGTLTLGTSLITGDGSAAAPSIGFASSTTTGYYRAAAGEIGVALAGVAAGLWYGNGLIVGNATKYAADASGYKVIKLGTSGLFFATDGTSGICDMMNNGYFDGANVKRTYANHGPGIVECNDGGGKLFGSAQSGSADATVSLAAAFVWNGNPMTISFYGVTPVVRAAAITAPTGGAVIDAESRTAINSIRTALTNIGLTS